MKLNGTGNGLSPDSRFIISHTLNPKGETVVRDQHEAEWDAKNGAERRAAELETEAARRDEHKAREVLEKSEHDLASTNRRKQLSQIKNPDVQNSGDTKFGDWNWYDKMIVRSAAIVIALLLGLGVANVAITILSSGIPVFLEMPWVAWMLGGLVPAASFSVKYGYHLFLLDKERHRYALIVYVKTFVLIVIWVILFALTFEGATASINWETIGTETGHGVLSKLRTATQILGEIMIGAALFLVIDRIQATYSSAWTVTNPDYIEKQKDRDIAQNAHALAFERLVEAEGRLDQLLAARRAFVERAVAAWIAQSTAGDW